MLVMDVRGLNGSEKAYARFWNHLHSIDTALAGVKLGLWLRRPITLPASTASGIVAEFGWETNGDAFASDPVTLNQPSLEALPWKEVGGVALARFELPEWTHELLKQHLGYAATIPGQVQGWWTDEPRIPSFRPTGSLLPEGGVLAEHRECLLMVDVDDWWGILSTLGLGSYTFGLQLEAGEAVPFLDEANRRWSVRRIDNIDPVEVRARWGDQAYERTRRNAPAVRVRVASLV